MCMESHTKKRHTYDQVQQLFLSVENVWALSELGKYERAFIHSACPKQSKWSFHFF